MTVGELARMFVGEGWVARGKHSPLTVVEMTGWTRSLLWPQTGLAWTKPSPNMTDFETALVYPAICLLEGTTLSEGRGTDSPFLLFGAPWLDATGVARALSALPIEGLRFEATSFVPRPLPGRADRPKHNGVELPGVRLRVTDARRVRATPLAAGLLTELLRQEDRPAFFRADSFDRLAGCSWLRESLEKGASASELAARCDREAAAFAKLREKYLLYR
jgi:uncharacterized protein YbbC (DUF1343 family)